jgi:purine-binding chemotaxis protein CheW
VTGKVLSFYLGDRLLGIDITRVKEIYRNIVYTIVPDSALEIAGLLNLRGQIVTLFNLNKILGIEENTDPKKLCVILKAMDGEVDLIGFLIDRTGDVVDVTPTICESPPANVSGIEGRYLIEVVKMEQQLILLLEPSQIMVSLAAASSR